jgi:hypothetical protein
MVAAAKQLGGVITERIRLEPGEREAPGREEAARGRAGLSMRHTEPLSGRVKVYKGGGLLIAERKKIPCPQVGGGLRGVVFEFSKKSRWRLMQTLGKIQKSLIPLFITLTYPDNFPDKKEVWRKHINTLGKRFTRRGWSAIVRKEFKRRLSGENAGKLAPHFHLLVWGASLAEMRSFLPVAWYEIVNSGDEKHLEAGIGVEEIKTWNGVLYYVSKYMAKVTEDDLKAEFPEGVGRFWSYINFDLIPWAEIEEVCQGDHAIIELFRLMRRYARMKGRGSNRSMTILCNNPDFWLNRLL